MEKINIKTATIYNIEDIKKIQTLSNEEILSNAVIKSELENSDNFIYFIAYVDEKPVGYIASSYVLDTMDLLSILVIPEYREKKIATNLIENMIYYCNKNNIKSILLEVKKSNTRAINLYTNFEFKLIDERKNYYKDEDALIYKLEIK